MDSPRAHGCPFHAQNRKRARVRRFRFCIACAPDDSAVHLPGQLRRDPPPLAWGVWRNVPFAILGAVIVVLFYRSARKGQDAAFRQLWLTVVLSFACYIPVVLFADAVPAVGMLMIPKTCAYVWTVLIGYNALRKL